MSAVETMIRRFAVQFGPPNTPDDEAFIGEFRRSLAYYEQRPDILERAANEIIDTSENPFWPAVGKVRKIAERIAAEIAARSRRDEPREFVEPDGPYRVSDEKRAEMNEIVQQAIKRMAGTAPVERVYSEVPAGRTEFEAMQRKSPNAKLHRLTDRSRAMAGEGE